MEQAKSCHKRCTNQTTCKRIEKISIPSCNIYLVTTWKYLNKTNISIRVFYYSIRILLLLLYNIEQRSKRKCVLEYAVSVLSLRHFLEKEISEMHSCYSFPLSIFISGILHIQISPVKKSMFVLDDWPCFLIIARSVIIIKNSILKRTADTTAWIVVTTVRFPFRLKINSFYSIVSKIAQSIVLSTKSNIEIVLFLFVAIGISVAYIVLTLTKNDI